MSGNILAWVLGVLLFAAIVLLHAYEVWPHRIACPWKQPKQPDSAHCAGGNGSPRKLDRRPKPSPDMAPYLAWLYAGFAMLIFACCFMQVDLWHDLTLAWTSFRDPTRISLSRFAAALTLIGMWYAAARQIQAAIDLPKASWWNLGGSKRSPSWEDVRRMTLNCPSNDPVICEPSRNRRARIGSGAIGQFILLVLLIEGLIFLADGPVLPKLLTEVTVINPQLVDPDNYFHHIDLQLNANLTALLALIAAAISIYFTHRQLQAKVKADSRQAWLDKLRGEIARFIALADIIHDHPDADDVVTLRRKMTASRLEMELMLNPSEKDHRLLMFLSIKLAFFQWNDAQFREVHDVQNLIHAIETDPAGYIKENWDELLGPIPERSKGSKIRNKAFGDLVGYVMRLSHVVLKREWERVKQTR